MLEPQEAQRRNDRRSWVLTQAIYSTRYLIFLVVLIFLVPLLPVCAVYWLSGTPLPDSFLLHYAYVGVYALGWVMLLGLQIVFRQRYLVHKQSLDTMEQLVKSLERDHPELLVGERLRQLIQDQRDASNSQGALWQNVLVAFVSGVFFLVLGHLLWK